MLDIIVSSQSTKGFKESQVAVQVAARDSDSSAFFFLKLLYFYTLTAN